MVHRTRLPFRRESRQAIINEYSILRVDPVQERGIRGFIRFRVVSEDPEELGGPVEFVVDQIPLPAAEAGDPLCLGKIALALPELLFDSAMLVVFAVGLRGGAGRPFGPTDRLASCFGARASLSRPVSHDVTKPFQTSRSPSRRTAFPVLPAPATTSSPHTGNLDHYSRSTRLQMATVITQLFPARGDSPVACGITSGEWTGSGYWSLATGDSTERGGLRCDELCLLAQ